jgi:hypothetical protein
MAMHRRTVRVATPAELLMFSEGDCVAPDDEASWVAFRRWQDARRAYGKAHPDSELGTVLDQLRFERRVRHMRAGYVTCESGSRPEIAVCIFA